MPPCSLASFTRSIMPLRNCLPKPASGPDRSWMEPRVISVLLTPWLSCACSAGVVNAVAHARADRTAVVLRFMLCLLLGISRSIHGLDLRRVFLFHQLALELHGRSEFFVFGRELGIEQEELLDLLHAGKLLVHPVDLLLDQFLPLRGARQTGVITEGYVRILGKLLHVVLVAHEIGRAHV